jgi:hypothetical protein
LIAINAVLYTRDEDVLLFESTDGGYSS